MNFREEMEKWFHPHIVAQIEGEFSRLEARIKALEVHLGLAPQAPQIPAQGAAAVDPQNPPAA